MHNLYKLTCNKSQKSINIVVKITFNFLYKFSRLQMYSSWQIIIILTLKFMDCLPQPSLWNTFKLQNQPSLFHQDAFAIFTQFANVTVDSWSSDMLHFKKQPTASLIRDEWGIMVLWPFLPTPKFKIENVSVIDFTHYTLLIYIDVFVHNQP